MHPPAFRDLGPGLLTVLFLGTSPLCSAEKPVPEPPPIRALLVLGGSSHGYTAREQILVRGIRERVARKIEWTVHRQGEGESDVRIPLFESAEWAKGFEVVVHDHCFPRVKDTAYVDRVLAPHRAGLPAVLLHGTMMSFRTGDERWFEFCGVKCLTHEPERAIRVEPLSPQDPILKAFTPWEIPREELYRVEKVWLEVSSLTDSADAAGRRHVNAWTHRFGPVQTRVFGTTLGNETATLRDPAYLDLVARGFLWALGDTDDASFIPVPAADSLRDLPVETSAEPLLRPGVNGASRGVATAFSWGFPSDGATAPRAIDGDPATAWRTNGPGPGGWQVKLERRRKVGAVAVFWEGKAPLEATIETSEDGVAWDSPRILDPETLVTTFDPVDLTHLRLSVPRTRPGEGFGLCEVAIYGSLDEIPSAIPIEGSRRHSAGSQGLFRQLRLAYGWKGVAEGRLPEGEALVQWVPTASGSVFVSTFPTTGEEEGALGTVYEVSPTPSGGLEVLPYLTGVAPGTRIAWDGEWLYTLSGPRLDPVRRALGKGPADERQKTRLVYRSTSDLDLADLRCGDDGWLHAQLGAEKGGEVIDGAGHTLWIPAGGEVRFRRDGTGLSLVSPRRLTETPSRPVWGEIEGLTSSAEDGPRIWIAVRQGTGLHLACLTREKEAFSPGPIWNDLSAKTLPAQLSEAARPSIRREAAFEILRRKRDPGADIEGLLAANPSPELARSLITVISGFKSGRSLAWLVRLARSGDPVVQVPAFLALGDHPAARHHPVFSEIGKSTNPAVTAAIFEGIRRSGSQLAGAGDLALELSVHPDAGLARMATDFLITNEESGLAFAALDRAEDRGKWKGALEVLSGQPRLEVVEGLIVHLGKTNDPELRRGGLEALSRLYFADPDHTRMWEGTRAVDRFLKRALENPRVHRPALLEAMRENGIPDPDAEWLARIARNDLTLEAAAVEALLDQGSDPRPETRDWLNLLSSDESRDEGLRLKVRALLIRGGDYPLRFTEMLRFGGIQSETGEGNPLDEAWFSRSDHALHLSLLLNQSKTGSEWARVLAWRTLFGLWERADLAPVEQKMIEEAFVNLSQSKSALPRSIDEILLRFRQNSDRTETGLSRVNVADLQETEILEALGTMKADRNLGRGVFRSLQCGKCHNIHGEGPVFGPDLTRATTALTESELLEALVKPGKRIATGFTVQTYEDAAGRRWSGWLEGLGGEPVVLRDRAGNRVELPLQVSKVENFPVGFCQGVEGSLSDLSNLMAYLRSLKD